MISLVFRFGIFTLLFACFSCAIGPKNGHSSSGEIITIHKVLANQQLAWNKGNLEEYMQGYWQNDSLSFIGKNGITYGWQQILQNYQKGYPNASAMGQLTFTILKTELLGPNNAYVAGKWHLQREAGNLQGHFTLLWRKINGRWVIVSDHSS